MFTNIEILSISAVVMSNVIAYLCLRHLKIKEKLEDQKRINQHKMF
jgi:hypothetical protein